jgi:hypothetical protein
VQGVDEVAHQNLVEKVLNELLFQRSRGQQAVQVRPEQLGDKVDVCAGRRSVRLRCPGKSGVTFEGGDEDVREGDDVLVADVLEQLELAVGALGEDRGREGLHDLAAGLK